MPRTQTVLLSAILVVLCLIGLQLNRIANSLSPVGSIVASLGGTPHAANETRAERSRRLQREMDDAVEDAKAMIGSPTKQPVKPPVNR